jgi:hypothetical protein
MSILSIFFHGRRKQMQENSEVLAEARECNQRSTASYQAASGRLETAVGAILNEFDSLPHPDLRCSCGRARAAS